MRLFVALDFPDSVREEIRGLIARLRPHARGARWARPEGMHVTLKFVGQVEPKRLDAIAAALALVRSNAPVDMRFRGLGFFPSDRRPRVLWCGIEASANLAPLAADIERAVEPLGIPSETRDFVPHLTLARFDSPRAAGKLAEIAAQMQSIDLGSARESVFHLYESVTKPSGAEYSRLRSFPFVKDAA